MTFVAFSSPRGRHMQREQRIHVCPGPANAVAVHLVFNALSYVVNKESLSSSMTAARKLVHRLMEEADHAPAYVERHATLKPLTAQQASVACNTGGVREQVNALWQTALHGLDHMGRVRALIELADMAGMGGEVH